MRMLLCWLITWFILCSGGFVYNFASGPCFFDVCARFNQLLLKHWWKLCQACKGRLLYLENNSRWGRVGFSELGCIHLFIYFWLFKGCFKGTKKRADFFMFLCSEPTFIWLSYISCQRETTRECCQWFCAASDGGGQTCFSWDDLVPGLHCWYPGTVSSSKVLSWFEPLLNIVLSPLIVPVLWPSLPCVISPVMWLMFSVLGWGVVLQLADCDSGSTQPSLWAAVKQWNNLVPQISLALRTAAHCCNLLTRWVCSHLLVCVVC